MVWRRRLSTKTLIDLRAYSRPTILLPSHTPHPSLSSLAVWQTWCLHFSQQKQPAVLHWYLGPLSPWPSAPSCCTFAVAAPSSTAGLAPLPRLAIHPLLLLLSESGVVFTLPWPFFVASDLPCLLHHCCCRTAQADALRQWREDHLFSAPTPTTWLSKMATWREARFCCKSCQTCRIW